ncbi:MAG: ribonuclease P protein component [Jatrophihabitantaceae bacterium]
MLPSAHRLRRSGDFATAVRQGRRVRSGAVVVHRHDGVAAEAPAVIGFVVSRAVGGSVIRHRVTRRLRHVVGRQLAVLPTGTATVIRALPDAAASTSADLEADVARAFDRLAAAGTARGAR